MRKVFFIFVAVWLSVGCDKIQNPMSVEDLANNGDSDFTTSAPLDTLLKILSPSQGDRLCAKHVKFVFNAPATGTLDTFYRLLVTDSTDSSWVVQQGVNYILPNGDYSIRLQLVAGGRTAIAISQSKTIYFKVVETFTRLNEKVADEFTVHSPFDGARFCTISPVQILFSQPYVEEGVPMSFRYEVIVTDKKTGKTFFYKVSSTRMELDLLPGMYFLMVKAWLRGSRVFKPMETPNVYFEVLGPTPHLPIL